MVPQSRPFASKVSIPTIPEALALGLQYQQSRVFDQAEPIYRQVLQADPKHAGDLHLLGTLAHQTGVTNCPEARFNS